MENTKKDFERDIARICLECDMPTCNAGKCVRYKRLSRAIILGEDCVEAVDKKPHAELYTYDGESMSLREWAEYSGISYATLKTRLNRHGNFEKAITEDVCRSQYRNVEWEGKTVKLSTLCMRHGVNYGTVKERLKSGMPLREALSTPVRKRRYVEWDGEVVKITDLCARYGISYDAVSGRLRRGWSLKDALTTPKKQ